MARSPIQLRIVLITWLSCCLLACGGGNRSDSSPAEGLAAAQTLAASAGRAAAAAADIDPALFTRRQALADPLPSALSDTTVRLFNFGESNFSRFFPSHQADHLSGGFAYRYYPETGAYLIVDESARIYVLGGPFGPLVSYVGVVTDYLKPCAPVATGFDVAKLDEQPVVDPGGDGGGSGGGDGGSGGGDGGAGGGSGEGAIRGADVRLYDATGRMIGAALSDDKGLVRLKACGAPGPFLLEYSGNSQAQYFDEGIALREGTDANAWVPFPAGEKLTAYVENLVDHHVVVTVMTHAAAEEVGRGLQAAAGSGRAGTLALGAARPAAAAVTVSAVRAANEKFRAIFNLRFAGSGVVVDDVTNIPALAYSLESLRSFRSDRRGRYGQMLTALAKAAAQFNPTLPNPAREMTKQLTRDLSDGVIDGKDSTGAAVAPTTQVRAYDATQFTPAVVALTTGRLTTETLGPGSVAIASSSVSPVSCGANGGNCYPFGTVVVLQAVPTAGAEFKGWAGACAGVTGTSCVVTMSGDKRAIAAFSQASAASLRVTVTGIGGSVASDFAGITCPSLCTADFPIGTVVTLRATAAAGSTFAGWSDPGCPGTGSCTLTMSAARSVTASFNGSATLTVVRAGDGNGLVNSSAADINCGTACSNAYPAGTVVLLNAIPLTGSAFTGWSGACSGTGPCAVVMDAAKSVTATFAKLASYNLAVTISGTGQVFSSPPGIANCTAGTCTASYLAGTAVSLQASPGSGQTFVGWSGACTGSGSCSVTMDAAKAVTATFVQTTYVLTVRVTGSGTVTTTPTAISNCSAGPCTATLLPGSVMSLRATGTNGQVFVGWSGDCAAAGSTPVCTLTMSADRQATANFLSANSAATLTITASGPGTVSSTPAGINTCRGSTCTASFVPGTIVTLSTLADTIVCVSVPCFQPVLLGWSGDCVGVNPCTLQMSTNRRATASFGFPIGGGGGGGSSGVQGSAPGAGSRAARSAMDQGAAAPPTDAQGGGQR